MTQQKTHLNWKLLYFGPVKKREVAEAVQDPFWQRIREYLKGKSLEEKYDLLRAYVTTYGDTTEIEARLVRVRVTNYVTALSRGGLIKPEDYR